MYKVSIYERYLHTDFDDCIEYYSFNDLKKASDFFDLKCRIADHISGYINTVISLISETSFPVVYRTKVIFRDPEDSEDE